MKPSLEDQPRRTSRELVRAPSAFLPLLFSAGAMIVLAVHVARFGTAPEADEGAAAHLWQLFMAGQVPVILFFAAKWLPRSPRAALAVLGCQAAAGIVAALPVYLVGL